MNRMHIITAADREEFTQDNNLAEFLEVMEIIGDDKHNSRGSNTDKKGELAYIETPGDIPAHAGYSQTFAELLEIGKNAYANR